jgi:uncharacterized lipoprotein
MNRNHSLLILVLSSLILASCANPPQLFWPANEGSTPPSGEQAAAAPSQKPLVVPPDLRGQVSVPEPDKVDSVQPAQVQQAEAKKADAGVAGTAVSLDTRVYNQSVATVFSAVVDAMTALNMPVQSVDSPSGTITTDWVRKDASTSVFTSVANMVGAGGPLAERYRFVVRVLRLTAPAGVKTQLEIRMLGQVFENHHWVNKQVKYKASNDLFSAVADQLARREAAAQSTAPATSAGSTAPAATSAAPSSSQ